MHNNNNNNNNNGGGGSGDNDSRLDRRDGISLFPLRGLSTLHDHPRVLRLSVSPALSTDQERIKSSVSPSDFFPSFLPHHVSPSFFHSLHSVHPSRHSPPAPGTRALNTGERETRRRTHAHALHLPRPRRLIRLRICDVKSSCVGSRCAPVTASASDGTACALGAPPSDHPTIIFDIHHHHPALPPPPSSPPPPPAPLPPPSSSPPAPPLLLLYYAILLLLLTMQLGAPLPAAIARYQHQRPSSTLAVHHRDRLPSPSSGRRGRRQRRRR